MKNRHINDIRLGGDTVDTTRDFSHKTPQRKPNKHLSGKEMLHKAMFGTPNPKPEAERKMDEINSILKK